MDRWPLSCVLVVVLTFGSDRIGAQLDYDLRLVNGSNTREGRVEVYYRGVWGTVCYDRFGVEEALIVCRQLGFPDSLPVPVGSAFFGAGSGPCHVDDLSCQGLEMSIKQCKKKPIGINDCKPDQDAGVICMPPTPDTGFVLRLVGGPNKNTGRVEVRHNGYWGTVCNDFITANAAKVICRQLGYIDGKEIGGSGEGSGPIWMDSVVCQGTESNLASCSFDGWAEHDCEHAEDLWVSCNDTRNIRLVNGPDDRSGRLEVFYNDIWGTVCDDEFSDASASVVCSMMFGNSSGVALKEAAFGMGPGPIWLDQVECNGDEMSIFTCRHNRFGLHDCYHQEDVGVKCPDPFLPILSTDENLDPIIRLVDGTDSSNGRLEVFHEDVWGTVCSDNFDDTAATVACRMLGFSSGVVVPSSAYGQVSDPIWLDDVVCMGTEMSIFDCVHAGVGSNNCDHTKDVSIMCSSVIEKVCSPDGTILVRGMPFGTSAGFAVNEDGVLCTVGPFVLNNVNFNMEVNITGCEKETAVVFTYGPNLVTQEHLLQSRESKVLKILCKEITETDFNISRSMQVDVNATDKVFNGVTYDVRSDIYPSTNLFVGDWVTWSITYPVQYKLEVTTCTANPGLEYNDLNKVLLVNDACSQDLELVVDEFTPSTGNTSATLRVFKFSGNNYVFLRCKVLLCPHTSSSCKTSCVTNRKKRGAAAKDKEGIREVSNVLRVMESYDNGAPSCSYIGLTLLLVLFSRLC